VPARAATHRPHYFSPTPLSTSASIPRSTIINVHSILKPHAFCYTKRSYTLTQTCDSCQRNTLPFNHNISASELSKPLSTLISNTSTLQNQSKTNRGNTVAMAMKRSSSSTSSNSSIHSYSSASNVRASCYAVNASTASLQGFHYSTTPSSGAGWCS
jgi:hypothetical protein